MSQNNSNKKPVLFYIVRRTGCVLCREAALELSSRFNSGEYRGNNSNNNNNN